MPIDFASSYVAKVLPKRILALQRNLGVRCDPSAVTDSKYSRVRRTASACSGRMLKSWSRASSFSVRSRTAIQPART